MMYIRNPRRFESVACEAEPELPVQVEQACIDKVVADENDWFHLDDEREARQFWMDHYYHRIDEI